MKSDLLFPALLASREILLAKDSSGSPSQKEDRSPVTAADLASNRVIESWIRSRHPSDGIISEESLAATYANRKQWNRIWFIDPLDGTTEFIAGRNEYGVSLGLAIHGTIQQGVIVAPELGLVVWGVVGEGTRIAKMTSNEFLQISETRELQILEAVVHRSKQLEIPIRQPFWKPTTVLCSRSHHDSDTGEYLDSLNCAKRLTVGACIKFIRLAEGVADYYPRLKALHEWDIAGGHGIVKAAGGNLFCFGTKNEVRYNSESLLSPPFEAY